MKGATANATRHHFPSGDDPTSDKFDSSKAPSANNFRVAAVPVPASMTLAAWTREVTAEVNVRFLCQPDSRSRRSVGGVPATYLLYRSCFGFYFPAIAALHGGRGYIIYWLSSTDPIPKAAATFNQLVASIQFR